MPSLNDALPIGLSNLQARSRSKPKGGRDGVTAIIGRIVTPEPNMTMMIGVPVVRRGERSCAMVERPRCIRAFPLPAKDWQPLRCAVLRPFAQGLAERYAARSRFRL